MYQQQVDIVGIKARKRFLNSVRLFVILIPNQCIDVVYTLITA